MLEEKSVDILKEEPNKNFVDKLLGKAERP